ncbi:MAG TPA: SDR family oxidoreductase [Aquabacterium sp.]|uniref:SDR family oxidoreductase n=1 Tax=Aquabacterium sp. TaxID=1872578 RepID=UPI002E381ABF|nr:SDR family oxidoreductase [Aquabacterium sp.]HEX5374095.1 SDR family oxidoreductase [Aquabacterium sp.]
MKKILIIGATSAMAEACARQWAQRGDRLFLAARKVEPLQSIAADLSTRGAQQVGYQAFDATALDQHAALLEAATQAMGGLDTVLIAHGTLSDQDKAQNDVPYALSEIATNGTSVIAFMTLAANQLEAQGHGAIAVISSVAGDRGRQSNYVYGSAKALVSAFASGLRQRLAKKGVHVVTIKPGFVDTPMTAHLPKGPLWAQPEKVARDICAAIDQGRTVVYTPGFWRLIMLIIKHIPEFVFIKLKL